jgi:ABC-type Fe3+/spermidine/putrescine transport system ATPase subunit
MVKQVSVRNLEKSYGGVVKVVRGVSFEADVGRITTLLGPSGCGKTTTLRCIAGLESPDAGEILFGNQAVFSSARGINVPTEHRIIGMMFQSYALWPHMTVAENVAFGLRVRRIQRHEIEKRVRTALDLVRLSQSAEVLPAQMSGGQQQRVALARSLAYDPDVLLLDEPLANLDARLREEMRFELLDVQARTGVTTIYVTHDQSEAMAFSSRIIVMQNGSIAQDGSPEEIYERPANRFVAEFVGDSNFIEARPSGTNGVNVVVETPFGQLVSRSADAGAVAMLMIRPADIEIVPEGEGTNVLHAEVENRVFLGDSVVLWLKAAGGSLRMHTSRRAAVRQGDQVRVRLPPERLIGLGA